MAEQLIRNEQVIGSIPIVGSKEIRGLQLRFFFADQSLYYFSTIVWFFYRFIGAQLTTSDWLKLNGVV